MATFGCLNGVHRQRANRIDTKLFDALIDRERRHDTISFAVICGNQIAPGRITTRAAIQEARHPLPATKDSDKS